MNDIAILIIDDEAIQRESMAGHLGKRGLTVFSAASGEEGLAVVSKNVIDIVLTDYRMPGIDGFETLRKIKDVNPEIDVVIITAFGSVQNAVDIMKHGAYDYLTKPIDLDELDALLDRLIEKRHLQSENKTLKRQLEDKLKVDFIFSQSKEMETVLSAVARVAASRATVLIRGESGSGKELIARALHYSSPRSAKPFITVNVAALTETLLESELFGHEKGAFTGAVASKEGKFEMADGGTIFLDEIGEIPPPLQVKLLRVIQFGEVERVGGTSTKKVDVRIVGATHRNLEGMIEKGEFREDLYYRINVVPLWLPPLRKRKIDVPVLVEHFVKKYGAENGKNVAGLTKEALDRLMKYDFPGNVRELENIIERAIVLCRDEYITVRDLPNAILAKTEKGVLDPYNMTDDYETKINAFESELLNEALQQAGGNQSAAARLLKMSERRLRSRLERLSSKPSGHDDEDQ